MKIRFLRHATLIVTIGDTNILVDPMFAAAGTADPITNTPNPKRNPLVDLPFEEGALLNQIEALNGVIVTHLHNDHWDARARELLPKSLPIFCQPEDAGQIEEAGFGAVTTVVESTEWRGLQMIRTGGQHGLGDIGKLMAPVSGFVIEARGEPVLYIAGDTIWCSEVEETLGRHRPEIIVVNAGAAQFNTGDPITMNAENIITVANAAPQATVIAVHMEAINHCLLSREELKESLRNAGVRSSMRIPEDGEQIDA